MHLRVATENDVELILPWYEKRSEYSFAAATDVDNTKPYLIVMVENRNRNFIGWISLYNIVYNKSLSLGIVFPKTLGGSLVAALSVKRCVQLAFSLFGVEYVEIKVNKENTRVAELVEKSNDRVFGGRLEVFSNNEKAIVYHINNKEGL